MNMQHNTGELLSGINDIKQCVLDILSTPIGTRIMREDYGSLLPELIDQPLNEEMLLQCYAAIIIALQQFEPRIIINGIRQQIDDKNAGSLGFVLGFNVITSGMPEYQEMAL